MFTKVLLLPKEIFPENIMGITKRRFDADFESVGKDS
jgi:hypothetical protein